MPIVDDIEPAESCADTEREFQIKHRYTDAVLFEAEAETLRECVAAAVKADADLTSADLTYANLTSANLTSADLTSAIGPRVLSIGPIGSRNATLIAMIDDSGDIRVTTGYFRGTLAAFEAAVQSTHGDNEYGQHYRLAIALINAKLGGAA